MPQFHDLTVLSVTPDSEESVVVEFECPDELLDAFAYAAGQHLGVKHQANDKNLRRTYSICSSVGDRRLRIGVRRVANGVVSGFLNGELKPGATLTVMTPNGQFGKHINRADGQHYVAFAAGS